MISTMAKRGPKPTPTKILQYRGSWRGDLKKDQNTPPNKAPIMPSWLSKEAQIVWRRTIKMLKAKGTLTETDGTYILLYCQAYIEYKEVLEYIEDMGKTLGKGTKGILLTTTQNGNLIQNPIIGIRNKAWEKLCKAAEKLGLPPSARPPTQQAEIKTKKEKKKERFFKKPG